MIVINGDGDVSDDGGASGGGVVMMLIMMMNKRRRKTRTMNGRAGRSAEGRE